jgi:DNA-binding transcriptional regulator GbsR (MarR family)
VVPDVDDIHQFAEDLALWFEQSGVPRMAGRILGWLLVCEPAHQSAEQLAAALGASRGSISTMTRLLTGTALVERVAIPGDRRTYYRIEPDWSGLIAAQHQRVQALRKLVEAGLDALEGTEPGRADRLRQIHGFASFWDTELEAVLRRRAEEEAS